MNRSRAIQLIISLIIGAICLWFAFRAVDLEEASAAVARVPWWGHAAYCLAMIFQFVIRSFRWRIQVEGVFGSKPPVREAVAINAVAFASVFLIPFRLGELVRPYILAQRGYMTASAALAQSAVERILDGLVTTLFFAVVLVLLGDTAMPDWVGYGGWAAMALFGGGSIVLAVAYRFRSASETFWRRLIGIVHEGLAVRLVAVLSAFLDGLKCFKDLPAFLLYVTYTVVFWGWNGFSMWLMMGWIGMDVGLIAGFFTVCFLVIGVMVPAPPGNVGNFHFFATQALTLLGVGAGIAAAFAVLIHGWQVVTLAAWAGLWIFTGDISLANVRSATQSTDETDAE